MFLVFNLTVFSQSNKKGELKEMPGFQLEDETGNMFDSKCLEGKYVLIDFWASWCGPCHKKFPALQEIYEQFHDSNFEIVGISTDKKKDSWLKALEANDLPWIQLIDSQNDKSIARDEFGISSLPVLFLFGPDGKLVARDPDLVEIRDLIK